MATDSGREHDYLPAAGRDALLPFYDVMTAALGVGRLHSALLTHSGLADGQRMLEIGCGTGKLSIQAKRTWPTVEVVGMDPDPLALARAARKAKNLTGIRFDRGYSQALPYPDACFDRVLSALMLHHLDPEAKIATAAEISRVLRPGGSLILADFAGDLASGVHGFLAHRVMKSGHLQDNRGDAIPQLLTAAGLEVVALPVRYHRVMGAIACYRATRPAV
ncbi:class I SAM-dependent methyltransferase [Nocardia yunnanensis]|nr:class I SAM-dependent methyltransferase [Nocardia yunnanensis]